MTQEQKLHLLELTTQLSNINGSLLSLGIEVEDSTTTLRIIINAAEKQIEIIESLRNLCNG